VSLEAELATVDAARRALNQNNAALALIELSRHAERFPRGKLQLEAQVLRVRALKLSGREAEARELGRQFIVQHPRSPLVPRVREIIEPSGR
jgi:outer membrane protein assembly factor BamD (BamD/ComL family)